MSSFYGKCGIFTGFGGMIDAVRVFFRWDEYGWDLEVLLFKGDSRIAVIMMYI